MMQDWLYRALNHESLNWLCRCKVYRRTNRCKLISYLKLNIFEVFFVVISMRVKSRTGRGPLAM